MARPRRIQQIVVPENPKFPSPASPSFTFIDLFAGIGGFRLAMQANNGRCVFSSEFNDKAQATYAHNFGEIPYGDITLPATKDAIPQHFDVLCGGFPCQAFSIAGKRLGFEDTRGTLFFDVADILRSRRPKAFLLENVKNLVSHDEGRTFKVIMNTLTEDLGYSVAYKVMSPHRYADVPQNRERVFIVGFDPKQVPQSSIDSFKFPNPIRLTKTVPDCLTSVPPDSSLHYTPKSKIYPVLKESVLDPTTVYQWRRSYVRENHSGLCPTLTAVMGTGGHNVPIVLSPTGIRKLSPKDCLNFQGYPAEYEFPPTVPVRSRYTQAGNSVAVPLVTRIAANLIKTILGNGDSATTPTVPQLPHPAVEPTEETEKDGSSAMPVQDTLF